MIKLRFNTRVITPLFMGNAYKQPEFRTSSFKGAIRQWFRILGGEKKFEKEIFGSTERQSRIKLVIYPPENEFIANVQKFPSQLAYLGYGVIGWNGRNTRSFIKPDTQFQIDIEYFNLSPFQQKALLLSIWALSFLGGLGSRNRRGWGSVHFLPNNFEPDNLKFRFSSPKEFASYLKKFIKEVENVFGKLPEKQPPGTRLFKYTRFLIGAPKNHYIEAMKEIGEALRSFRNRKFYKEIKGLMIRAEFKEVHNGERVRPGEYGIYASPVPKAAFGLPNNYISSSRRKDRRFPWQVSVEAKQGYENISRRASPLFISVIRWETGEYSWIISFIPSKFLPDNAELKLGFPVSRRDSSRIPRKFANYLQNLKVNAPVPNYRIIEKFLTKVNAELNPLEVRL